MLPARNMKSTGRPRAFHHRTSEREERYYVGQHHEVVQQVLQIPDKVAGKHRAEEHKHQRDHIAERRRQLGVLAAEGRFLLQLRLNGEKARKTLKNTIIWCILCVSRR